MHVLIETHLKEAKCSVIDVLYMNQESLAFGLEKSAEQNFLHFALGKLQDLLVLLKTFHWLRRHSQLCRRPTPQAFVLAAWQMLAHLGMSSCVMAPYPTMRLCVP